MKYLPGLLSLLGLTNKLIIFAFMSSSKYGKLIYSSPIVLFKINSSGSIITVQSFGALFIDNFIV